jgi:hypothetical protein
MENANSLTDRKHHQKGEKEHAAIFFAIRSTVVDGQVKIGIYSLVSKQLKFEPYTISQQWASMQAKLVPLLDNHPEEEHQAINAANHHILFGMAHKDRRQG